MKLCVAFDLASFDECIDLAKKLKGLDIWIKIGLRSYLRDGIKLIESIKKIDEFKIFLDLKIYDIPNTMADACEELAKIDVDMINIHASAGKTAMITIMDRLNALHKRPLILAVSALTSFDNTEFSSLYHQNINDAVKNFSKISYESGLDGMVCSVYESLLVKEFTCKDFITLTPGIRPFKEEINDQKRVANIQCAKENLSDFIVVGRPIYKALEPRKICEEILACIK
ncbi:orotidine-5'-phosphate decarboxylase [Campylobacter sp.]|uniref:orotidine-5'-phosphate decarboxylase n=1 Tax=Campylobacter sp. TaxID=205 RepID=UPI0025C68BA2|nr:orotidine-5'-phosphate decarboxylase [Campylobacter sp.]